MRYRRYFQVLLSGVVRRFLVFAFIRSHGSLSILLRVVYTYHLMRYYSTVRFVRSGLASFFFMFYGGACAPFRVLTGSGVVRRGAVGVDSGRAWGSDFLIVSRDKEGYRARTQSKRYFSWFCIRVFVRSLHCSVRSTKEYVRIGWGARTSACSRSVTCCVRFATIYRQNGVQGCIFGCYGVRQRRSTNMGHLYSRLLSTYRGTCRR